MKAILDTRGLDKLKSKLKRLESSELEWGFIQGRHSKADMSYAALAWLLEEGSRAEGGEAAGYNIPPRPAFKQTIAKLRISHEDYEDHVARAYQDFLYSSNRNPQRILNESGEYVVEMHKDTMRRWYLDGTQNTDNAPMTVRMKGFNQPFMETGELVQNVTYQTK